MVSCKLQGGLGNYMFQAAAAHSLAVNNNTTAVFDLDNAARVHRHANVYKHNILRNLNVGEITLTCQYNEPHFHYSEIPYQLGVLLNGYFQSDKYLNRSATLELFSIDDESYKFIVDKYGSSFNNAVSIHVRRGDYLAKHDRHPVQSIDYYKQAMQYFDSSSIFYIFSDDIEWCKENFKGSQFTFIEDNADYIDLWLMSLCDHNIIANSSFSWWGAWLNQNPNKIVIAPKNWFGPNKKLSVQDLIPEKWIQI